ncbi:MAG TPA: M48 family metalloprotease [Spongiibacteraceae bacterium]|nr:M48 family metalloprotease [Spongiibacteraceae bacterium]
MQQPRRSHAKVARNHFYFGIDVTRKQKVAAWLLSACMIYADAAAAVESSVSLPELGDSASATFSTQQEYELGRAWLKLFRSQVQTVSDPLLQDYLEYLIYKLASYSQLKDRRIEVVIIDNPTINAFAAPGGVVGVHNGTFLSADNEAQLASVLGHELAHLSQRHFVRGQEQQQRTMLPTMAAMLGSLVLAATSRGDAGIAAMAATQAASQQAQLRFSRENEQEADRIGMETVVNAGYDANAFASMFENMLAANRFYGRNPPEFLLTHPLTESRVADARNRARDYPRKVYVDNLDFQLMKARVEVQLASNASEALKKFKGRLKGQSRNQEADHYGLTLAYLQSSQPKEARAQLDPLLTEDPHRLAYIVTDAEIDIAMGGAERAAEKLRQQLRVNPDNYPLTMTYANALLKINQPQQAEAVLQAQVKLRPTDPDVWYLLAETHGLAGNIVGVHQARAEYFVLNGVLDKAEKQLSYALPLVKGDNVTTTKIEERIRQIKALKEQMQKM